MTPGTPLPNNAGARQEQYSLLSVLWSAHYGQSWHQTSRIIAQWRLVQKLRKSKLFLLQKPPAGGFFFNHLFMVNWVSDQHITAGSAEFAPVTR